MSLRPGSLPVRKEAPSYGICAEFALQRRCVDGLERYFGLWWDLENFNHERYGVGECFLIIRHWHLSDNKRVEDLYWKCEEQCARRPLSESKPFCHPPKFARLAVIKDGERFSPVLTNASLKLDS